jgi:hypothetical protein
MRIWPRLLAAAVVPALVAAPAATGDQAPSPGLWSPGVAAAKRYAKHRAGSVRFAIIDPSGDFQGFHSQRTAPSASLLKAMLLVAYLRRHSVRDRDLNRHDRRLLRPMITRSDNAAATRVNAIIGHKIYRVARKAHMRRFRWNPSVWGLSRTDPRDQARFFLQLDELVPARHLDYAKHLLANVVGPQRWGVGRVPHSGWELYFKGGWGSGSGAVDHQVALLRRGEQRVSLAIMTTSDGSHAYGKETLRGVAKRLLRGLPSG